MNASVCVYTFAPVAISPPLSALTSHSLGVQMVHQSPQGEARRDANKKSRQELIKGTVDRNRLAALHHLVAISRHFGWGSLDVDTNHALGEVGRGKVAVIAKPGVVDQAIISVKVNDSSAGSTLFPVTLMLVPSLALIADSADRHLSDGLRTEPPARPLHFTRKRRPSHAARARAARDDQANHAKGHATFEKIMLIAEEHLKLICGALSADQSRHLTAFLQRIAEERGLIPGVHPGYRWLGRKIRLKG